MRPLVTPEEMALADQAAIDAGTTVEVLMERAGRAVARVVMQVAGARYGNTVTLVCGRGNNGGDGFVAARILRGQGMGVRCLSVGDISAASGAARHHLELLLARGISVRSLSPGDVKGSDVVVDAIFGTGFRGRPEGAAESAIDAINSAGCPVVSIDIPSGVNATNGSVEGRAVEADVTVAMAAQKIGTAIGAGALHSGVVEVADIGIPTGAYRAAMTTRTHVSRTLPERAPDSHKRSRGSVALLGGSAGMSGAVVLAVRGALRTGAGYVTAGVPGAIGSIVASGNPEALTRSLGSEDVLGPSSLEEFEPVLQKATAVAIGPGLGQGPEQTSMVEKALSSVAVPMVLDADGLNALSADPGSLSQRTGACVITPHPVELSRLIGKSVDAIQADRVSAARVAANELGCTVVLKGYRTLVAEDDRVVVNPTGGPSLATAGTGDVLTGVIAALLAQGLSTFDASVAGVFVHGLAGDLCGDHGTIAGDVAEAVPAAMDQL